LTQAFVGKTADEAVRTLPLLSVCGLAQGAAASSACERALGMAADDATSAVRRLLVLAETLREHLIRAVMDWPRFLRLEARKLDMLDIMRSCERLRRTLDPDAGALTVGGSAPLDTAQITPAVEDLVRLVETLVIGEPIGVWRSRRSMGDLDSWSRGAATPSQELVRAVLDRGWAGAGRAETRFLPSLEDRALIGRLLGEGAAAFVAAPTWDGMAQETTALARQAGSPLVQDVTRTHGSGLLARIAARLVEIGDLPRVMTGIIASHTSERGGEREPIAVEPQERPGRGLAQVEAARGRLVHSVEIEDDVVRRYAILAPTEWNFHEEGAAARGLADIAARTEDVREIADIFVTAVDPCVGYQLRVH
jgi:coenzyme F420-reducing hydrogenase alpha subunit